MEQVLRRELKTWQKAFKAQHGRDPTKRDILADPSIAGTYDTWQAVGGNAKAKPRQKDGSSSTRTATASSSKHRLDEGRKREQGFKTPSKKNSYRLADRAVPTSSPGLNPFHTPTKGSLLNQRTTATPGSGNSKIPFATPSKRTTASAASVEVSPARSIVEVDMTPSKRSPLLDTLARRNKFTASKSPTFQRYVTASPSKLRSTLIAGLLRTPTKNRAEDDAALNQALVAYTPRTKARKRLRGEDVPPTPDRRRVLGRMVRTDPKPVQKRLGAFGFASNRKPVENRCVSASMPASVFSRTRSIGGAHSRTTRGAEQGEDEEMLGESPIKAVAKLRLATSAKPCFRPLFASPSGNHASRDLLGTKTTKSNSSVKKDDEQEEDADAVKDDGTSLPVGGLFAVQVQQRRLRRARETSTEIGMKKHKSRPALNLPCSSDDEGAMRSEAACNSSSPAYRRGMASSPNTEMTIPSSTNRPNTNSKAVHLQNQCEASSPTRKADTGNESAEPKVFNADTVGWRKVHQVELSDEDEPRSRFGTSKALSAIDGVKNGEGRKKIFSISPYQLYGTVRTPSTAFALPSSEFEDEEGDFSPYTILNSNSTQPKSRVYAVDPTSLPHSDGESDDETHASLARLKLSPVRHAPSTKTSKQQRVRLLNNIFDPTACKKSNKIFNPEARFGPLQPSSSKAVNDDDYEEDEYEVHTTSKASAGADGSDDDDDWQQEVDEDFTFLDSEIELQDVA
uniref:DNA replication regulator SLD2 n=1 Tax=Ustilago esculenta TaxID=185366 RepID=A0A481SHL4_9BASI|nr:hypothetical protein UEMT_1990 [Ustilago esculenta]